MKKIILTGKIVYWILLIATVVLSFISVYYDFLFSSYNLSTISTDKLFEMYDIYRNIRLLLQNINRILLLFFYPIFVLVVYFSLKYFNFIKKEKTHKTPYIIAVVTFILLVLQYFLHNPTKSYYGRSSIISVFLYTIDFLQVVNPYLLFPITIILSKYAAMYIFKKYNKNFEEKLKEQKIRKLRMKLKATEEELNSLQDLQEFNNKN